MRRIEPYFPLSHGVPRVDDRLILSGIIFILRNGLRWRDPPREYDPHKTIYNRFIRWQARPVQLDFGRTDRPTHNGYAINTDDGRQTRTVDDRSHPFEGPSHCSQSAKRGMFPDVSGAQKAG